MLLNAERHLLAQWCVPFETFHVGLTHTSAEDAIDVGGVDMIQIGGLLVAKKGIGLSDEAGISVANRSSFDLGIKTAAFLQFAAATSAMNLPIGKLSRWVVTRYPKFPPVLDCERRRETTSALSRVLQRR